MKKSIILLLLVAIMVISVVFYSKKNPEFFAQLSYYSQLANPSMRLVRVEEGSRREEIAEVLMDKLDWDEQDKRMFLRSESVNVEGRYFPKTYIIYKNEVPSIVAIDMFDEFSKQIEKIKERDPDLTIDDSTALKIASMSAPLMST